MQFTTLASGSSGNCLLISEGGSYVMADAGAPLRRVLCALRSNGSDESALSSIFITHDHSDHISALPVILRHIPVPVFAPPGTAGALRRSMPEAADYITTLEPGDEVTCGGITVRSFRTPHDATDSVGYTFTGGGTTLALATDMGCVTDETLEAVLGAEAAVIEANHDPDMLRNGRYPQRLKARILSKRGHLSNLECGELAVRLWKSGARRIVLAHISKENNTPADALRTVGAALMRAGAVPGRDVELSAAPRCEAAGPYEVARCCL